MISKSENNNNLYNLIILTPNMSEDIVKFLAVGLDGIDLSTIGVGAGTNTNLDTFLFKCTSKDFYHPNWALLAGRIKMYQVKSSVSATFSGSTELLKPILKDDYYRFVKENA